MKNKKCNCDNCSDVNCENYHDESLYEVPHGKVIFLIQGKYLTEEELKKFKRIK